MTLSETLETLARRAVISRFAAGVADGPDGIAAVVADILAVHGAEFADDPALVIESLCRGALAGAAAVKADLAESGAELLRRAPALAQDLDPADLMGWALKGMAAAAETQPAQVRDAVEARLESLFTGAGAVFAGLSRTNATSAPASSPAP